MRPVAVRILSTWVVLALASPVAGLAQQLPTLEPEDYGQWESFGTTELSPDGRWLAYAISRIDGDGELRIREIAGDSIHVVEHGTRPSFSSDGRWLAWGIGHSAEERERLREAGTPVRAQAALMNLETGATTVIDEVSDFEFSTDGSAIALHGYAAANGSGGRTLTVRDLVRGVSTSFGNVAEVEWQKNGPLLAMIIHGTNRTGNGVRTFEPGVGVIRVLESDTADYTGLSWRADSDDLAVMRVRKVSGHDEPTHTVIVWRDVRSREPERLVLDPATHRSFPAGHRIVEHYELRWSYNGATLFVGLRELTPSGDSAARPTPVATTEEGDTAGVAVWRSDDVEIVPERDVQAMYDRNRSWVAAWHIDDNRLVQLADSTVRDVTLSDGRFAIGVDPSPYERERMFGPQYRDLIAIDIMSGERTRFAERVQFHYGVSPTGRYMLYVRDDDYWAYDTRSRRERNITAGIPTSFINLQDDHTTAEKPPYGTGGWTTNDSTILLHDRYDIWEVRPDGTGGVNLTNGAADRLRHRRVWLNPTDRVVDRTEPVYVTLYGERTKQYGYGRIMPAGGVERLVLLDRSVTRLSRADSADVFMYRVEGFDDSPDLFVGGPRLADAVQVTETNPFQAEYAWGRSEVIDFRSATGEELQAALFYPADYEPGRTYPMIVDIYEITSNTVHTYRVPSERSAYNTTVFTQEGYFVLRPDIVYRGRDPGVSAVEALVPAVETVLERGSIDRERIGLIGHSWGGYQTAFAVTQTDLFSAAVAGAPLTNLISMYLSIFWNTGGTDARIFEIDQGRMEVPFWEDLDAYMRNSPLFNIQQMNTPLLVAFGDEDGAVDWHQGIELYNAARRAGKDMVLLVYEGENHSLAKEANQLDYHRRIRQWFDYYLKDGPEPDWVAKGLTRPGT